MADLRASITNPPAYLEQEDPMNGLFKSMVVDRLDKVAYPRALDLFFDFVGAGEGRNAGYQVCNAVVGPIAMPRIWHQI